MRGAGSRLAPLAGPSESRLAPLLRDLVRFLAVGVMLGAAGCSGTAAVDAEREPGGVWDPIEPVNRAVYRFNDLGDRYVLRPVAVGYEKGLAPQMRAGVRNFFDNALYPITAINSVLQGKFADGGRDLGRFLINTTIGLAGLFDPATDIGLPKNDEDFGQTLGVWGVPEGPYLMVPVLGPFTLRHGFGSVVDSPLTPWFSAADFRTGAALYAVESVDDRSRLLKVDDQLRQAFDPYLFVRDAYIQNRRYRTSDGNLPEDDYFLEDFDDFEDGEPD